MTQACGGVHLLLYNMLDTCVAILVAVSRARVWIPPPPPGFNPKN